MVQDLGWRLGSRLNIPALMAEHESATRARGAELAVWELAYNERDLEGWLPGSTAFEASGAQIVASGGDYDPASFTYQTLILDRITAGDFSLEAEIYARPEAASFTGFVFGSKGTGRFHGALFLPARKAKEGASRTAWVDLMSSFGGTETKAWRHLPVDDGEAAAGGSSTGAWNRISVDVVGRHVDLRWNGELLTTYEFPDRDVLAGRLGLVVGNGEARFRNVRFLARDPRDPAARILRGMRLEQLESRGEPVAGSFLGLAPAVPTVERWVSGKDGSPAEFDGWSSGPTTLQLFALWSIKQNDLVRVDQWLSWLKQEWSGIDLRIISVCSPNDKAALADYLKEHPFPGIVGLDSRPKGTVGIGLTFDTFFVRRFSLPRLLLIDVDGRVVWEGDPGFSIGETYAAPYDTYLNDPLEELVAKRKLRELAAWRGRWDGKGVAAAARGDLAGVLPILRDARGLLDTGEPVLRAAAARLDLLEAAVRDIGVTGELMQERGVLPAFDLFVGQWLPLLDGKIPRSSIKTVKRLRKDRTIKHWARALKAATKAGKKDDDEVAARQLLTALEELEGRHDRRVAR